MRMVDGGWCWTWSTQCNISLICCDDALWMWNEGMTMLDSCYKQMPEVMGHFYLSEVSITICWIDMVHGFAGKWIATLMEILYGNKTTGRIFCPPAAIMWWCSKLMKKNSFSWAVKKFIREFRHRCHRISGLFSFTSSVIDTQIIWNACIWNGVTYELLTLFGVCPLSQENRQPKGIYGLFG